MINQIYFIIIVLFLCIFPLYHLYRENKSLKFKLSKLQNVNEYNFNYPHVPNSDTHIKRIGAIFFEGNLETQEHKIVFVTNNDYFDMINKEWNNICIEKDHSTTQSQNE